MAFNRAIEEPNCGPLTEGDGRGLGPTLGEDVGVDAERRAIERAVFERRKPREAGGAPQDPPVVEGLDDADPSALP